MEDMEKAIRMITEFSEEMKSPFEVSIKKEEGVDSSVETCIKGKGSMLIVCLQLIILEVVKQISGGDKDEMYVLLGRIIGGVTMIIREEYKW